MISGGIANKNQHHQCFSMEKILHFLILFLKRNYFAVYNLINSGAELYRQWHILKYLKNYSTDFD
jgi:hypothetical protein